MQNYIQIAIALLLAYLALENYWINKRGLKIQNDKLRLDLFERRLSVFEACQKLFLAVVTTGQLTREEIYIFTQGSSNSEFLFGKEIKSYIDDIRTKSFRLIQINERLSNERARVAEERNLLADEALELETWFTEQFSHPTILFRKYLHFTIERLD